MKTKIFLPVALVLAFICLPMSAQAFTEVVTGSPSFEQFVHNVSAPGVTDELDFRHISKKTKPVAGKQRMFAWFKPELRNPLTGALRPYKLPAVAVTSNSFAVPKAGTFALPPRSEGGGFTFTIGGQPRPGLLIYSSVVLYTMAPGSFTPITQTKVALKAINSSTRRVLWSKVLADSPVLGRLTSYLGGFFNGSFGPGSTSGIPNRISPKTDVLIVLWTKDVTPAAWKRLGKAKLIESEVLYDMKTGRKLGSYRHVNVQFP